MPRASTAPRPRARTSAPRRVRPRAWRPRARPRPSARSKVPAPHRLEPQYTRGVLMLVCHNAALVNGAALADALPEKGFQIPAANVPKNSTF